jgi:hypothetical protein
MNGRRTGARARGHEWLAHGLAPCYWWPPSRALAFQGRDWAHGVATWRLNQTNISPG